MAAQAANELARGEAVEEKVMAGKEAKESREKTKREKKEALRAQAEEAARNELYNGIIRVQIARPVSYKAIKKFERSLSEVDNVRVASVGGSINKGAYIIISIDQPVRLLEILGELPDVQNLSKSSKGIEIALKSALTSSR